jgi:hypothetical protein
MHIKAYEYNQADRQPDYYDFNQFDASGVICVLNAELPGEKSFQIMDFLDGMPADRGKQDDARYRHRINYRF